MISNKKADLSLQIIVIAALVLVVLVILIIIFSGKIGGFNTNVDSCPSNKCEALPTACTNGVGYYSETCKKTNPSKTFCCPSG